MIMERELYSIEHFARRIVVWEHGQFYGRVLGEGIRLLKVALSLVSAIAPFIRRPIRQ